MQKYFLYSHHAFFQKLRDMAEAGRSGKSNNASGIYNYLHGEEASKIVFPESSTGIAALTKSEHDPVHAIILLARKTKIFHVNNPHGFSINLFAVVQSMVYWRMRAIGLESGNIEVETKSLEHLRSRWDQTLREHQTDYLESAVGVELLKKELSDALHNNNVLISEMVDASKKRIDLLEKTYHERLRLEAPTKYWKDKADKHTGAAAWTGLSFVLLLFGVVIFASKFYEPIVSSLKLGNQLNIAALVLITPIIFLVVYVFRSLVKIFNQNLAAAEDAHQRRALIFTYLSLTRKGETVPNEHRLILLHALFRPSGAVAEDDGPSASVIEAALKAISSK
jgi:hypothetical protein